MRFEVPQFIEIEDKIFGPFTWRQFVYLGGGVGVAVVIFISFPIYLFVLIGLPIGGLAFALAFYPVNNRPFSHFLESVVQFYRGNRIYHWKKKSNIVYRGDNHINNPSVEPKRPEAETSNINTLSRKLELNAIQKLR